MHEPMTLDLLNSLEIVDDDVMAVVNVYLADPECGLVSFVIGLIRLQLSLSIRSPAR
jgi:hypothetical protein